MYVLILTSIDNGFYTEKIRNNRKFENEIQEIRTKLIFDFSTSRFSWSILGLCERPFAGELERSLSNFSRWITVAKEFSG